MGDWRAGARESHRMCDSPLSALEVSLAEVAQCSNLWSLATLSSPSNASALPPVAGLHGVCINRLASWQFHHLYNHFLCLGSLEWVLFAGRALAESSLMSISKSAHLKQTLDFPPKLLFLVLSPFEFEYFSPPPLLPPPQSKPSLTLTWTIAVAFQFVSLLP